MSIFTLDTDGVVTVDGVPYTWDGASTYDHTTVDLTAFEQGYGTEAARELYEKLRADGWSHLRASDFVAFRNWAPDTLAGIRKDCSARAAQFGRAHDDTEDEGRQFWLRRQRGQCVLVGFAPQTVSLNDAGKVVLASRMMGEG